MRTLSLRLFRVKNWLHSHRFAVAGLLALAVLFFGVQIASAQSLGDVAEVAFAPTVNMLVTIVAYFVNIIAYAIGRLVVVIIGMVVIPILGYNNFGDSFIISVGWPIVRDIVNMFVIVVMLVLAVRTMVSNSANWGQQLPRLFLAVVMVNFSRTITLFLVDIGQVVMFTFVNSLRDIAAGNFVNLFQLKSFLSLVNADPEKGGVISEFSYEAFGFLATGYVGLMFLFVILGVMLLLAAVFIYRIVIIWVLVILSPIAFFAFGVKSIIPQIGAAWSKWMDMLVGAIVLGPVLVFFLWLGLATAAQGSLATAENFPVGVSEDIPTLYSEVLELDSLLSLFIGMALIMLGFQAASTVAGSFAQQAGGLIAADTGRKIVGGVMRTPASIARRSGRVGAGAVANTGVGKRIGDNVSKLGVGLAKSGIPGGGQVGLAIAGAGSRIKGIEAKITKEDRDAAKASLQGLDAADKVAMWQSLKKSSFLTTGQQRKLEQLTVEFGTNKAAQKQLKKQVGDDEYDKIMADAMQFIQKNKDDLLDDKGKKAFFKTKAGHMSAWLKHTKKDGRALSDGEKKEHVNEIITDDDFKASMFSEADVSNEEIRGVLRDTASGKVDKDGNTISWAERLEKEKLDKSVKDAYQGKGAEFGKAAADHLARALKNGHLEVSDLKVTDFHDKDGNIDPAQVQKIAQGLVESGADLDQLSGPGVAPEIMKALDTMQSSAATESEKRRYQRAYVAASNDPREISAMLKVDPNGGLSSDRKERARASAVIQDFVKQSPTKVGKLASTIAGNGKTDLTEQVVAGITDQTLKDLRAQFDAVQDKTDRDSVALKNEIKMSLQAMSTALAAEIGAGQSTYSSQQLAQMQKRQREIANASGYYEDL